MKFPFFTYEDEQYCQFMIKLMQCLEIRYFPPKAVVCEELDECLEILFVTKGFYIYGYEINKKRMYRRQFGRNTIVGGFQITFENRHQFMMRT
mmetsp:Transcript_18773/g.28890  ORF Transcript_18773/g.28890 Transcript_18773/m.28890 type:complete len:93 (-) Transcript_18773:1415-1693(-)